MNTTLLYIIEGIATSGILYATYTHLMERHTSYLWCRLYLLMLPILSVVIPALQLPLWPAKEVARGGINGAIELGEVISTMEPTTKSITFEEILFVLYAIGVIVMLLLLGGQLYQIFRLKKGAERQVEGGVLFIRTPKPISTFSLFRTIWLWSGITGEELKTILKHEMSHIRHHHSFERLLMELFKVALWWNPFVWIAARRLSEVEEFEADNDVLTQGEEVSHYIATIFKHAFGYSPDIANGLHDSLTKKRFKMMIKKSKSRYARLRMAATLPLIALLVVCFGSTAQAASDSEKRGVEIVSQGDQTPILILLQDGVGRVVERGELSKVDQTIIEGMNIYKEATSEVNELLKGIGISLTKEEIEAAEVILIQLCASEKIIPEGEEALYSGVVVDLHKQPVAGAIIQLEGSNQGVVSDLEGHFSIRTMRGTKAKVQMVDFEDKSFTFGGNPEIQIYLHKEGAEEQTFYLLETQEGEQEATTVQSIEVTLSGVERTYTASRSEQMPRFQGGDFSHFQSWVMSQISYPEAARSEGREGTVYAKFTINEEGELLKESIEILRSPDSSLSEEVRRVLEHSPRWEPATNEGVSKKTTFTLPIQFKL